MPPGGRQTTKMAVSVKVFAGGPGLLTLAVPGNQRVGPGGPGGAPRGRRGDGRSRYRAFNFTGVVKGLTHVGAPMS